MLQNMRNKDYLNDRIEDVVEDAIERYINNIMARRGIPQVALPDPGADFVRRGNPFIETIVTNNDLHSHIRSHLSHIEEHYGMTNIRLNNFRALREYILSP